MTSLDPPSHSDVRTPLYHMRSRPSHSPYTIETKKFLPRPEIGVMEKVGQLLRGSDGSRERQVARPEALPPFPSDAAVKKVCSLQRPPQVDRRLSPPVSPV